MVRDLVGFFVGYLVIYLIGDLNRILVGYSVEYLVVYLDGNSGGYMDQFFVGYSLGYVLGYMIGPLVGNVVVCLGVNLVRSLDGYLGEKLDVK